MKKQDITYPEKLTELKLSITHPNNSGVALILVEGKSDIKLFRKLFNLNNCKVEQVPGGNQKLEECVKELLATKTSRLIIGIRDSDFIKLESSTYSKENMFLTDFHDMEMTLISEDETLNAVLFEYTHQPKEKHTKIRGAIVKSIEQISFLKWLNTRENLILSFKFDFQDLISYNPPMIDFDKYFKRVLSKSPSAKVTDIEIILHKITKLMNTDINQFQMLNGHDFIKSLSQYIKTHGNNNKITEDIISSSLRIAYKNEFFTKTSLYQDIKKWADVNKCLICLKN